MLKKKTLFIKYENVSISASVAFVIMSNNNKDNNITAIKPLIKIDELSG